LRIQVSASFSAAVKELHLRALIDRDVNQNTSLGNAGTKIPIFVPALPIDYNYIVINFSLISSVVTVCLTVHR